MLRRFKKRTKKDKSSTNTTQDPTNASNLSLTSSTSSQQGGTDDLMSQFYSSTIPSTPPQQLPYSQQPISYQPGSQGNPQDLMSQFYSSGGAPLPQQPPYSPYPTAHQPGSQGNPQDLMSQFFQSSVPSTPPQQPTYTGAPQTYSPYMGQPPSLQPTSYQPGSQMSPFFQSSGTATPPRQPTYPEASPTYNSYTEQMPIPGQSNSSLVTPSVPGSTHDDEFDLFDSSDLLSPSTSEVPSSLTPVSPVVQSPPPITETTSRSSTQRRTNAPSSTPLTGSPSQNLLNSRLGRITVSNSQRPTISSSPSPSESSRHRNDIIRVSNSRNRRPAPARPGTGHRISRTAATSTIPTSTIIIPSEDDQLIAFITQYLEAFADQLKEHSGNDTVTLEPQGANADALRKKINLIRESNAFKMFKRQDNTLPLVAKDDPLIIDLEDFIQANDETLSESLKSSFGLLSFDLVKIKGRLEESRTITGTTYSRDVTTLPQFHDRSDVQRLIRTTQICPTTRAKIVNIVDGSAVLTSGVSR